MDTDGTIFIGMIAGAAGTGKTVTLQGLVRRLFEDPPLHESVARQLGRGVPRQITKRAGSVMRGALRGLFRR
ncbi:MAG: hypothetical protein QOH47_3319 [Sphingomonadales bacterium]|nr:hypothetical protein [Sphingomonadales bacterium]